MKFVSCDDNIFIWRDGVKCNFYQWLDPEWPGQMQHVLTKMWEEIDELKQSKRHEMHRLNQRNSVMHEQVRLAMQELEQEKKKAEEEKKMVEEEKKQAEKAKVRLAEELLMLGLKLKSMKI